MGEMRHSGRAVEEFLIAPPLEPVFRDEEVLERLREHMNRAFPALRFVVSSNVPFRHAEQFVVMPIMSVAHPTDPDAMLLCKQPSQLEMQEIWTVLHGFDPACGVALLN